MIKAPNFEDVAGFEKEANSLFEVKCFTDRDGMAYVNLDASDDIVSAPPAPSLNKLGSKASILETWEVEGSFNWKLAGSYRVLWTDRAMLTAAIETDSAFVFPSLLAAGGGIFSLVASMLKDNAPTHVRPSVLCNGFSWPVRNLASIVELVPLSSERTAVRCHVLSQSPLARDAKLLNSIKEDILASVRALEMKYVRAKESCEM